LFGMLTDPSLPAQGRKLRTTSRAKIEPVIDP